MIFELIIYILLAVGVFFNLLAGFGLLRFPDVYTRL
ncbi:MAG: monovalent cation/H(+) antiporter subunit G, partial [Thermoplasmatales archaeon]|nr:monovalent cation/H(+) antiporter subunit G [Thermoplasmatales archaeon]